MSKNSNKPNSNKGKSGNKTNHTSKPKGFRPMRGRQGRKDSNDPRVNLDNAREDKVARDIEAGSKQSGANDITTWNRNGTLFNAVTNYPFSSILGDEIGSQGFIAPGIMVLSYSPSIGAGADPIAFNKTFQALYSDYIASNSRTYKYDFPDVAMFTTAGNELFAALCEPMRIWGIYKSYKEENRYLVDPLIRALGWNPKQFRRDLSRIRYELNDLILQTRAIWVPNTIPVLKRWMDLNLHVYTDAEGNRSQLYAYRRMRYWKLSETGSNAGTSLVPACISLNESSITAEREDWIEFDRNDSQCLDMTWDRYQTMLQDMVNSLQASGDRAAIYGDLKSALGDEKIYAMPAFDENFSVIPEYNAEILMQIENAETSAFFQRFIVQNQGTADTSSMLTMVPLWYCIGDTPDGDYIQPSPSAPSKPTFSELAQKDTPAYEHLVNMHLPGQPSGESIMVATRAKVGALTTQQIYLAHANGQTDQDELTLDGNTPTWSGYWTLGTTGAQTVYGCAPSSTSTEIFHKIEIWQMTPSTGLARYNMHQYSAKSANEQETQLLIMAFDWHPFYIETTNNWASGTGTSTVSANFASAYGDYDNYVVMSDENIRRMNHVALYSAMGVPLVGPV